MTTTATQPDLTQELQPVVAELLERHLETTQEWFPHELVPWSQGRDFVPGEVGRRGVGGSGRRASRWS